MPVPSFVQAGAGATITGLTGQVTLSGATPGNFLVLHLLVDTSSANPFVSGASGCEKIDGTDNDLTFYAGIQVGATDAGAMDTWVGRATAASVSVDIDTNGSTNDMFMRIYEFSGVVTSSSVGDVINDQESIQGTSTTVSTAELASTRSNGLFLQMVGVTASQALGDFTGETGGNYTETVAEYVGGGTVGTIQLQSAPVVSPGTVTGGTLTITSNPWGTQGLVVLGTIETLADNPPMGVSGRGAGW